MSINASIDSGTPAGARVLLVEDHVDSAKAMSRLLQRLGHEVHVVHSVRAALHTLETGCCNVIVSDIGLPDGSGTHLMEQVRAQYGDTIPGIAISGYGKEQDIDGCRKAGFDVHLTKPVRLPHLDALIRGLTGLPDVASRPAAH